MRFPALVLAALLISAAAPRQEEEGEKQTVCVRIDARFLTSTADLFDWKGGHPPKKWTPWDEVKEEYSGELDPDVEKLVQMLDAETLEERDRACEALAALGKSVLPQLKKAHGSATGEVRNRLTSIAAHFFPTPEPEIRCVRLAAKEHVAFLKTLAGRDDVAFLAAPRLTALSGQKASIQLAKQVNYIGGYEVVIGEDGRGKTEPVVRTAHTGQFLTLLGEVAKDLASVRFRKMELSVALARTDPLKPRKTETPLGPVEDPEIQDVRVTLTPTLKSGEVLLVGPVRMPWSGREDPRLWLMICATVTTLDD